MEAMDDLGMVQQMDDEVDIAMMGEMDENDGEVWPQNQLVQDCKSSFSMIHWYYWYPQLQNVLRVLVFQRI